MRAGVQLASIETLRRPSQDGIDRTPHAWSSFKAVAEPASEQRRQFEQVG